MKIEYKKNEDQYQSRILNTIRDFPDISNKITWTK